MAYLTFFITIYNYIRNNIIGNHYKSVANTMEVSINLLFAFVYILKEFKNDFILQAFYRKCQFNFKGGILWQEQD